MQGYRDILREIAAATRERVATERAREPLETLAARAVQHGRGSARRFERALTSEGMSFICEVKKASPSKGVIAEDFDHIGIAREYEAGGADAISCLTEPRWFQGSDEIFREVRASVATPLLRKDFVVDEYQLYQAKALGADCALVICMLADGPTLARYLRICEELDLAVLVEAHDADEVARALDAGARIIGVNNRDLRDFSVDFSNSIRLRGLVPPEVRFVAESGVKGPEDVKLLHDNGVDAVLIGETLMRSADKRAALAELRSLL